MNQLFAAFGINWELLAMQAANFGLLLLVLWYFLYRPVLRIIDERRTKIADSVIVAQNAQRELEDAKERHDEIVGQASREAEATAATARIRADERGTEIVKQAEAKAGALMHEAAARAEEAKRQAMAESSKEIARAAMLAAEKILREKSA